MSLYDDLGVNRDATAEEIRGAYRKRVMTSHPDRGGDREEFERVQNAYDVLSDPDRRARYDETGDEGGGGPDNRFSEISAVIVTAFDHVVMQAGVRFREADLIRQTCEALRQHKQGLEASIAQSNADRTKLKDMANRLSFDGDGPDILGNVMRQRIRNHENAIQAAQHKAQVIDQAIEYLNGYGFKANRARLARPAPPAIDYDSVSFDGFGGE